jgi:hypothetical protein
MISIFEPLHNFLSNQIVPKLRKEVEDFRVFNHADLQANAYLLIMKFIGTMPGWHVRVNPRFTSDRNPDLVVFQNFQPKALCQFIFGLKTEAQSFLPTQEIEESIAWLKELVNQRAPNGQGRGYIIAAMDYDQNWFVPKTQEKQHVFIVPVNCHDVPLHHNWRPRWDEQKRKLF